MQRRSNHTWRRRVCLSCKSIFTTIEQPELTGGIGVRVSASTIAPFNRDRLFLDVYKSCEHRPQALDDATALTEIIIASALRAAKDGVLAASAITAAAHTVLERYDRTAATIYAAYHSP